MTRPRLGDILVHNRLVTAAQLTDALRTQVVYGGRLGTNLIELGAVGYDDVARALARQHRVPAALVEHLMGHDQSLLSLITPDLAKKYLAIPIARIRGTHQLVVCFRDPTTQTRDLVARAAGVDIVAAVACELAVYYMLERCYGIARPQRYATSQAGALAPLPRSSTEVSAEDDVSVDIDLDDSESEDVDFDIDDDEDVVTMPDELELVDLDAQGVDRDFSSYNSRNLSSATISGIFGVPNIADNSPLDLEAVAADVATGASSAAAGLLAAAKAKPREEDGPSYTLSECIPRIAESEHRSDVSDAVLGYLRGQFSGGLIAIVKGDMALGYRGFGGHFDHESVQSIVIPLSVPTIFSRVRDSLEHFSGPPPTDAHAIQSRFFKNFHGEPDEVVVCPVVVRERLVCFIYAHSSLGGPISQRVLDDLDQIARATGTAFLRLIKLARGTTT